MVSRAFAGFERVDRSVSGFVKGFVFFSLFTCFCRAMSPPRMRVNHLKRDELEFELSVRGVATASLLVIDMRASLASLLRLEHMDRAITYPEYAFDETKDTATITAKYAELELLATEAESDATGLTTGRCCSRGLHLLGRINRIPLKADKPEWATVRSTWLAKVSALLGRLRRRRSPVSAAPLHSTATGSGEQALEAIASDDDELDSDSDDAEVGPISSQAACSHSRPSTRLVPVHKWNLSFTGEPGSISVMDFIDRVTELRRARGCSEDDLFRSALDLFQGKALIWYRSAHTKVTSWTALVELLKRHYLPPDYHSRLYQELMNRTQGPNEPIVEYLACMQALIARYGLMPQAMVLDVIRRNLAPFYIMQLPDVRSLAELEAECLKLETKKYRAEHYQAPPRKSRAFVEPDLACLESRLDEVHVTPKPHHSENTDTRGVQCFNCKRFGHIARNCRYKRVQGTENSKRGR